MAHGEDLAPSNDGTLRFHLAVQRNRFAVILLMAAVAAVGRATGFVQFDLTAGAAALVLALASPVVFAALYRRGAARGWTFPLHPLWMSLDIVLLCWTIWLIHDSSPLWLIWFLTNATAAAFVAGRRAANAVLWASCFAYLLTLVLMGEIRGLDQNLALAVGRLVLLFGGTYFMLHGIADLREKRLRISELDGEKNAQLEELRRLASELNERTRELAAANRRIEEANRAKSQFLASMSHELRTPLNSIIGFSEILGEKLSSGMEPRYQRFLANILSSGRHLLGLINNILDLSKIEAGKMELILEPSSASDVVLGVASVMHGTASVRNVHLDVDLPADLPPIVVDPPRVKQILYNLVANAVKFSQPGSAVRLAARSVPAEESPLGEQALLLEVEDHGMGIRREDQELIFEEFRQVDGGTTRNMGGTGLGLALVKRFAEMHGGVVRVDSELGRGSTFRVFLPLDASRHGTPRRAGEPVSFGFRVAEALPQAGDSAPRVLVAEDDDEFARALTPDLEAAGYRVLRARDGLEALRIARSGRPAAITLDLVLPARDGWEVLQELKADPETAHIPVIIVSLVSNHELGFALGAADYFVKPLDRTRFLDRLREIAPLEDPARSPLVLVIDDDPQIRDFLGPELENVGYRAIFASEGREGVQLAATRRPRVVVLDLVMQGMDGFEAASALSRTPETRDIPVLVFTAKELDEAERRRLAEATSALLSKAPEDRRRVVAAIRQLAEGPRLREDSGATRVGG
jgi:signal transduction histidine kinase/CheY-like chemotaxis protein